MKIAILLLVTQCRTPQRRLLAAGHTVHGTVRDVAKATAELSVLPGASERLKLFKADLLKPDGFKEAMQVRRRRKGVGRDGPRIIYPARGCAGDRAQLPAAPTAAPPQGCTLVFHTASPYINNAGYGEQAQKRLVEPAVLGTENVLSACPLAPPQLPGYAHVSHT